jgi:DNA processing protein
MAHVSYSAPAPLHVLTPCDTAWPRGLRDLGEHAPAYLRVRGALPDLTGAIAIVGTRAADADACEFTRTCAAALAAAGRTIVSGGALGIDAAAHRGALDVGGATVAVLANGFDPPYPPRNAELFAEIAGAGGALVSEQEDGTPPLRARFLERNRLIAALATAVLVVQAPVRSGALSTAAAGNKLKRQIFTVPYAPWLPRGEGCLGLLRQGARICTSARDVLSLPAHGAASAAVEGAAPAENSEDFDNLDEHSRAVLSALRKRPVHPDELSASLGLHILKVQQALGQLVLLGLAASEHDGRYVRP